MQISPSILSADFAALGSELDAISNADWAHVDVMDNHFVPNLTLGLPVVEALARVSPVPLDCHLMIEDPDRWAPGYAEAGARSVTFHVEAVRDAVGTARAIRAWPRMSSGLVGSSIHHGSNSASAWVRSIASSTSHTWLASIIRKRSEPIS